MVVSTSFANYVSDLWNSWRFSCLLGSSSADLQGEEASSLSFWDTSVLSLKTFLPISLYLLSTAQHTVYCTEGKIWRTTLWTQSKLYKNVFTRVTQQADSRLHDDIRMVSSLYRAWQPSQCSKWDGICRYTVTNIFWFLNSIPKLIIIFFSLRLSSLQRFSSTIQVFLITYKWHIR
jgi:hypothetical protein